MIIQGSPFTAVTVGSWFLRRQQQRAMCACYCEHHSSSSSNLGNSHRFSTDSRVIYLNSRTRRRSVVHASADLAPLFIIPRLRQQQPFLNSLPSSSHNSNTAGDFIPSPLAIHLKHLIQRRRAAKRSKHHPHSLPIPPLPAVAPPKGVACGVPFLPQDGGIAAAAVGQQQLQQQQLYQLQDTQLLQLAGGPPPEGLGVAGRDVVSLSGDAAEADSVSPGFAAAFSLEAVASAALARWRESEAAAAATGSAAAAAATERDDSPFWQGLCDRIFYSRDLLPVSSLGAVLRLICCRYNTTTAAAVPFFRQHFALPQQLQLERSTVQQRLLLQQRLPSGRPVSASLLLTLTREFIDDIQCLSPAAAADLIAVFATCNCCSIELLQLLVRRSIDTWLLPEEQLEHQRLELQQQQQQQLFAMKPEAINCFSPHEFAVFCSALQHLVQQAQPLLQRRAQQQHQQRTLVQLLPLAELLCSATAFLLRFSPQEHKIQKQATVGSLAALAADALQQYQQQKQQQEQLLQLTKASVELLEAADAFIPLGQDEAAAAGQSVPCATATAAAGASAAAFSAKETGRLMSVLSTAAAAGASHMPRQLGLQQQRGLLQHQQQRLQPQEMYRQERHQENHRDAMKGEERRAEGAAYLTQQPGAAALLFMLQQTREQLMVLHSLLKQEQRERNEPPADSASASAAPSEAAASTHLQYVPLNPWEVPTADILQLMETVGAATAAAERVLLQPLLLRLSRKNAQHPLQQRQQQSLFQLLRDVLAPAVVGGAAAAPLLQAAAESLVRSVGLIISEALVDEVGRRFADLTPQEKERVGLTVCLFGIKDPYLRHYCRVYGSQLQQRRSISDAHRNKLAARRAAAETAGETCAALSAANDPAARVAAAATQ
ncbi:hypothetical protein, conserved [Eimeria maxima]|uniref:Uncharacterized protein n=1 Tax=Eimeria maxima TaxID=5804 RepID=U6M9U7_EIMMA|nr:hypothetical protein, conserved [Eimeria maxima]CDJ59818.1 hypothetical protein, conserved [Eimeria maxima]